MASVQSGEVRIKDLFQYRDVWMGCAIIKVVLGHSGIQIPWRILSALLAYSYSGVDIFIFASGIGCYFSLTKDSDPYRFIKRRIWRLVPAYWLFLAVWVPVFWKIKDLSLRPVLGNLFGVQYLLKQESSVNWYITGILILYILAPYLFHLTNRLKNIRQFAAAFLGVFLFTLPFWWNMVPVILFARFPIFFLGMCVARHREFVLFRGGKPTREGGRLIIIAVVAFFAGIAYLLYETNAHDYLERWMTASDWYPFILITPGLCALISLICKYFPIKAFEKALAAVGKASFELYLSHCFVFDLYKGKIAGGGGYRTASRTGGAPCCLPA